MKRIKKLNRQIIDLEILARGLSTHGQPDEMLAAINKVTSDYEEVQRVMATHELNAIWKEKLVIKVAKIESTAQFATYAYNARTRFHKDILNIPKRVARDCQIRYARYIDACLINCGLEKKTRRAVIRALNAAITKRVCLSESIMNQATANSILVGDGKAREWLMTVYDCDQSNVQTSGANFCLRFSEFVAQTYFTVQKTREAEHDRMKEDEAAREQLRADLRAAIAEARTGVTQIETSSAYNADDYFPQDLVAISSGRLDSGESFFD